MPISSSVAEGGGYVVAARNAELVKYLQRNDQRTHRALHVGHAAAIDASVFNYPGEGIVLPSLLDGHHVHVGVGSNPFGGAG